MEHLIPPNAPKLAFIMPRLRRAACAVCRREFTGTAVTERDGQVVHVACVP